MATTTTSAQQTTPTREQIEQRAYELYLNRGAQDGNDLADWLAAERELMSSPKDLMSSAKEQRRPLKKGTSAAG